MTAQPTTAPLFNSPASFSMPDTGPDAQLLRLPFYLDSFAFLEPLLSTLKHNELIELVFGTKGMWVRHCRSEIMYEAFVTYAARPSALAAQLHPASDCAPDHFDPYIKVDLGEAEASDLDHPLDLADDQRPVGDVRFDVQVSVLEFAASLHRSAPTWAHAHVNRAGQRSDTSLRQIWTIDPRDKTGSIDLPTCRASALRCFGLNIPDPFHPPFPEAEPSQSTAINPDALARGLVATEPFASDDKAGFRIPSPITIDGGVLVATNRTTIVRCRIFGLAGINCRMSKAHAKKLSRMLPSFQPAGTTVASRSNITILSDNRQRLAFESSPYSAPSADLTGIKPNYTFRLDAAYVKSFIRNSRALTRAGVGERMQLQLSVGVQELQPFLKASAEWGREKMSLAGINTDATRQNIDAILDHLTAAASATSAEESHVAETARYIHEALQTRPDLAPRAMGFTSIGHYAFSDVEKAFSRLYAGTVSVGVFREGAILIEQSLPSRDRHAGQDNEIAFLLLDRRKNLAHGIRRKSVSSN